MPIDPDTLSSFARDYAKGMTSIRGRRVQRLVKREFAGAECVLMLQLASGGSAALGLSSSGAAFCATDGRGKHASVVKWLHGSTQGLDSQFDLLKDSLPVLQARSLPLAGLAQQARLRVSHDRSASGSRPRVAGTSGAGMIASTMHPVQTLAFIHSSHPELGELVPVHG